MIISKVVREGKMLQADVVQFYEEQMSNGRRVGGAEKPRSKLKFYMHFSTLMRVT